MVGFKFKSDFGAFKRKHEIFIDHLTGRMAMDTDTVLKTSAGMPVKTGNMKSETRFYKNQRGQYRTEINVAYAAFQERGARENGTYNVKNYTTAGTSAGFFMRAIMSILKNRPSYIAEAKKVAGL